MRMADTTTDTSKRFFANGEEYTFDEMVEANAEDEEVIEWLSAAAVGDEWPGVADVRRLQ
jgi:hypothetical protein